MYNPRLKTGLLFLIFGVISLQTIRSNPLEQMGLTALRSIQPSLTGSGVKVAQPEGNTGSNDWQVNPASVGQPQSRFRWISSGGVATTFPNALGTESLIGHANSVGFNFYGNPGGMAPGVAQIDNYELGHFVSSIIYASPQPSIPAKVVNQSFNYQTQDSLGEQLFDNYAARHNVLFVSGIGNGDKPDAIKVFPPGTAYNGIGVGAFGGMSSVGPTADGRCKPDIVAPAPATSFSAPYVSGAAALLVQAGNQGFGGSNSNAATDIRTLKALLLNGAVKPNGWTNHPSHPLDLRYGSGVLNVLNSFKQLSNGKQTFLETTSWPPNWSHPPGNNLNNLPRVGWDFNSITNNPASLDRIHHYYFTIPADGSAHKFTATLTWNRKTNSAGINNLDLFLYRVQPSSIVAVSTSQVDNVEHISVPHLTPGRYDLQVLKSTNGLNTNETYAIAYEAVSTAVAINRVGNNVAVTWPIYPNGFALESSPNLNNPIPWSPVAGSPVLTNSQYQLLVPASQPQTFYRLRQP